MEHYISIERRLIRKTLWMQGTYVVLLMIVGLFIVSQSSGKSYLLPDALEEHNNILATVVQFCADWMIVTSYLLLLLASISVSRTKGIVFMSAEAIASLKGRQLTMDEQRVCLTLRHRLQEVGCESLFDSCIFRVRPITFMPHSPLGIGIFTIPAVVNIREDVMSLSQELWLPGIAHEFGHQYLPECLRSTIILWAPLFMVLALLEVESVAVLIATVASLVGIGLVRRINIVHEHLADAFAAQLVGKAEVIYSLGVLRDIAYSYFTSVNRMVAIMLFWRVLLVWVSLFLCTGCLQIPATLFALAVMETIVPKHSSLAKRIAFLNQHFNSQVSHGSE